ncbi:MAG: hypothetical protein GAK31_03654 [Stenotrophomonas maltophilia]|uniref:DUF885 domain-containing protein n=1 Tax=Stenotrophomonas maltophilia TaxID=40324 RepID=A0A7V8JKC1_STEMA|nr:MAG: hypothetical protein GAK31_03654 [Stenotrophomonas maltophilia]
MLRPLLLALTLACPLGACDRSATSAAPTAAPVAADPGRRAQQLQALYADYWEAYLALNPLRATLYGDNRFNDQWVDAGSADHRAQVHALEARGLAQAEAIGSAGLTGQDQLSYEIFLRDRRQALQAERFPQWMLPVSQMDSTAGYAVMFGSGAGAQPFATVQDHDHWLARAARVPVLVSTEIDNMRQGLRAGVVQPRVVVEKVLAQLDAVLTPEVETSPFWGPVQLLPDTISGADRQRLTQAYRTLITGQLNPALRRQRDFLATEYLPRARATVGLAALPQGTAWYAFNVQRETTTQQTPAQIHQIGLDEVARIHQQLRGIMAEVGFQGSLQEFFAFMQHDRRF